MSGARITILVAGDDSNRLAKLIRPLQAEQFRVVDVADREEVVNLAHSETPHLVLLDLKSPFDVLEKESARSYPSTSFAFCKRPHPRGNRQDHSM
jgi:DNA-binding response OmpR family regulator